MLKKITIILYKELQLQKNLCLYFPGVSDKILYLDTEGNCHAPKTVFVFDMFDSRLTAFGVGPIGYTGLGQNQMGNAPFRGNKAL